MRLMLCGLSIGLTLQDMRSMRVVDVSNIVMESSDMRTTNEEQSEPIRDATQDDINWLKTL